MINLKQMNKNGIYGFKVSGFRNEMFFLQKWLSHYGYGDCLTLNPRDTGRAKASIYSTVRGQVWFKKDLLGINKEEFAGMFKLAFAQFELIMPDESNSSSKAMDRVNKIGAAAVVSLESGEVWSKELYNSIVNEVDNKETQMDNANNALLQNIKDTLDGKSPVPVPD